MSERMSDGNFMAYEDESLSTLSPNMLHALYQEARRARASESAQAAEIAALKERVKELEIELTATTHNFKFEADERARLEAAIARVRAISRFAGYAPSLLVRHKVWNECLDAVNAALALPAQQGEGGEHE